MVLLGRYMGKKGLIEVVECLRDGVRVYSEGEVIQSEGNAAGESVLTYVRIMESFLKPADNILILGCGGGNLATTLARRGKTVTVVDDNPLSFVIARRFFGLPNNMPYVVSDFRRFINAGSNSYNAIAIDVGGPGFSFNSEFDEATCRAIVARLAPDGRIVMNVLVSHDLDPLADHIAARLTGHALRAWIADEPGLERRNAVIACLPDSANQARNSLKGVLTYPYEDWKIRRARARPIKLDPQSTLPANPIVS